MESLIFLDTHVAIWLYSGRLDLFRPKVLRLINDNQVCISHWVRLEMKYLNEIGRINQHPDMIIDALIDEIGLVISNNSIERIVSQAIHLDFTRDPFDRIIVADAYINNSYLISKDQNIRKNYKYTLW
ncbi:MAG: domain nuclease, a component of toxin-antitoxin system [Bacteroidetes bacterium]|nr:domain nuclease, a component of toxin-antitoxin system [Bacteroidota bacterium]